MALIEDWIFLGKLLPYDSKSDYDYLTVEFYDDLNTLLAPKYIEAFKHVYPQTNIPQAIQRMEANRKIAKSEVWKLVTYVDNTNIKK